MKNFIKVAITATSLFALLFCSAGATVTNPTGMDSVPAELKAFSEQKAKDMSTLVQLLGLNDPSYQKNDINLLSDQDIDQAIQDIVEKYCDADEVNTVMDNLRSTQAKTRSARGTTLNLRLPLKAQETGYYCGPASVQMIVNGYDSSLNVSQNQLASDMDTDSSGTILWKIAVGLNKYMPYDYAICEGGGGDSTSKAIEMTDNAIATLSMGYGVIFDTLQEASGTVRLAGYSNLNRNIYHYIAGEGYNTVDPSNRVAVYADPNDTPEFPDAYGHHNLRFREMCTLCTNLGMVF